MKKVSQTDIDLIKNLCLLWEEQLMNSLVKTLKEVFNYSKVIKTDNYVMAEGELPICLIAHCDTVFKFPPTEWFFDSKKQVLWSPGGAGFDDRAGVFMIIKILQAGFRPSLIFPTGEEVGGIGSYELSTSFNEPPFEIKPKYLIELDRAGDNDCVFYDCRNKEFEKYIQSFGFCKEKGTFTDICHIAPAWGLAAVNLSIGYYDEHTIIERFCFKDFYKVLTKVKKMLEDCENVESFKYIPKKNLRKNSRCLWCNKKINETGHLCNIGIDKIILCDECYKTII